MCFGNHWIVWQETIELWKELASFQSRGERKQNEPRYYFFIPNNESLIFEKYFVEPKSTKTFQLIKLHLDKE